MMLVEKHFSSACMVNFGHQFLDLCRIASCTAESVVRESKKRERMLVRILL
jgi:hypothetical protein